MTRPVVVLVGPPGAGKTSVGRLLATELGVGFRDTDADVAALAGRSIADIFFAEGEDVFREWEADAVREALAEHDGVLSLGGGAVLSPQTRAALQEHRVVFLQVGLGDALRRVGLSAARPVLAINPRAQLLQLLQQRLPLYREVADVEIDTDGHEIAEVVRLVRAAVQV